MKLELGGSYSNLGILTGLVLFSFGIIAILVTLSFQDINNIWAKMDLILGIVSLIIGLFLFTGFAFNKRTI